MVEKSYSREEMLTELHSIVFVGDMTYMCSEGSVEVEIYTSEGVSIWWEDCDEPWPAYRIEGLGRDDLQSIQAKVIEGTLSQSDIEKTVFQSFLPEDESDDVDMPQHFKDILGVTPDEDECIYAYFDQSDEESRPIFFSSQNDLAIKMSEVYSKAKHRWEDMDDDELQYYVERYKIYDNQFPMTYIEQDD